MSERLPNLVLVAIAVAGAVFLAHLAYTRPGYFTNQSYLGGLVLLELLIASVWMYRRIFFPLVVISFLLAGTDSALNSTFNAGRWLVLAVGALVGTVIMLKEHRHRLGIFHLLALFTVLSALVSAAVSRYAVVSFLKVLSLFLLFLYAATGARLAASGRENRFVMGLLTGCEVFVAVVGGLSLLGRQVMGNPNSLGAVMGVVAAPILLWGAVLPQDSFLRRRRMFFFAVAMYLTLASHARAGILAVFIACGLLCLALRRYTMLAQGAAILLILMATSAIFQPEALSGTVSSLTSNVIYKGKDPAQGLLSSRKSPWQNSMDIIQQHFWFGTGFGTADNGQDATAQGGRFATTSAVATEHGSSYLAVTSWVGIIGIFPFLLLLASVCRKIFQTIFWIFKTQKASHVAVPMALVGLAGLVHAGFEDWLFAPGYYLCVFYWCLIFMLADQVPSMPAEHVRSFFFTRNEALRQRVGAAAPSR